MIKKTYSNTKHFIRENKLLTQALVKNTFIVLSLALLTLGLFLTFGNLTLTIGGEILIEDTILLTLNWTLFLITSVIGIFLTFYGTISNRAYYKKVEVEKLAYRKVATEKSAAKAMLKANGKADKAKNDLEQRKL